MKRAILTPFGSVGDLNPFLWLGKNLQIRGTEVRVIATPRHAAAVTAAGLSYSPLGTESDYDQMISDPRIWDSRRGAPLIMHHAAKGTRMVYEAIRQEIGDSPGDVTVFSPLTGYGARLGREKLGYRLLTVHLQPSAILSNQCPPLAGRGLTFVDRLPLAGRRVFFALARTILNARAAPAVRAVCREEDIEPPRDLAGEWWNSPDGLLCLFPEWFAPPQTDWPQPNVCVGFPHYDRNGEGELDADLMRFLESGPPPILFTPGTAMAFGRKFFEASLAACAQLGRRAILATRFPEQIPADLPSTAIVRDYVPFSDLIPRTAAVVHHGGIGTVSQGLAAGVPQLVMAMAHDQPDNGRRLRRLGVGDFLYPGQYHPRRIAKILTHLTSSPEVASATARIKAQASSDSSARLGEALDGWDANDSG